MCPPPFYLRAFSSFQEIGCIAGARSNCHKKPCDQHLQQTKDPTPQRPTENYLYHIPFEPLKTDTHQNIHRKTQRSEKTLQLVCCNHFKAQRRSKSFADQIRDNIYLYSF